MSDLLTGTLGESLPVSYEDHSDLYNIYLAAELGSKTNDIIATLAIEPNQTPYNMITPCMEGNPQDTVRVDVRGEVITAKVVDRINHKVGSIDMSPNPKVPLCEKITQKTYENLSRLVVDKKEANARVSEKIKTAI